MERPLVVVPWQSSSSNSSSSSSRGGSIGSITCSKNGTPYNQTGIISGIADTICYISRHPPPPRVGMPLFRPQMCDADCCVDVVIACQRKNNNYTAANTTHPQCF
jgi:hypothetical protein